MKDLQQIAKQFIKETGEAHEETRGHIRGVVFHDDDVFIPYTELGYNSEYGFYSTAISPDIESEATYLTWTIHPVKERHPDPDRPWEPFAILDSGEFGYLLGERWQVAELVTVLQAFLERGEMSEAIDDDDEALGTRWLTISEAVEEANAFDPDKYPLDGSTDYRIRQAARRGDWLENGRAKQDSGGRWKFHARRFRGWLVANRGRTYDVS
jgi:hypothetical protein